MQGAAPVYSLADEAQARAESAAWTRFAAPADVDEFCNSWLALLCGQIGRCRAALLLLGEDENGPYRATAVWPDRRRDMQHLAPASVCERWAQREVCTIGSLLRLRPMNSTRRAQVSELFTCCGAQDRSAARGALIHRL